MSDGLLHAPQCYRFDGFEFRERTGELSRGGAGLRLPDQAGIVLLALLRAQGDLVSREEMRRLLWPGRVSGDFEGGLHAAVWKLRRALDDDGAEPRLVGTLPRRGYRLLVPVETADDRSRPEPEDPEAESPGASSRAEPVVPGKPWKARLAWILGAGAVLAGAALLVHPRWPEGAKTLVLPGGAKLEMAYLQPGEFAMGFDSGFKATEPVHRVTLTRGFWMGRTEVTQAQWRAVMGNNPSFFQGDEKPVEQVSWDDCQAFLTRLNQWVPSVVCRLPTEAEWEYAARAGRVASREDQPDAVAWHVTDSLGQTHPVGTKLANPWGLSDMIGNVWEWCSDGFGPYLPYPQKDPQGQGSELRSMRGGSFSSPGSSKSPPLKVANRVTLRFGNPPDYSAKDLGFRIVAVPRKP